MAKISKEDYDKYTNEIKRIDELIKTDVNNNEFLEKLNVRRNFLVEKIEQYEKQYEKDNSTNSEDLIERYHKLSGVKILPHQKNLGNIKNFFNTHKNVGTMNLLAANDFDNKYSSKKEETVTINKNGYSELLQILSKFIYAKNIFEKLKNGITIRKEGPKYDFYDTLNSKYDFLFEAILKLLEGTKIPEELNVNSNYIYPKNVYEKFKTIIIEKANEAFINYNNNSIINNEQSTLDKQKMINILIELNFFLDKIKLFFFHDELLKTVNTKNGGKIRPIRSKKTRRNSTKKSKTARRRRNKKNATIFR